MIPDNKCKYSLCNYKKCICIECDPEDSQSFCILYKYGYCKYNESCKYKHSKYQIKDKYIENNIIDINDYHKIIELLNKYYKNFEIEEGDEFYLFTLNDEGLNNNDAMELANSLGMSKLIDESKLLNSKTYKDMDWDYTRLSVKFIIKRDSMYLQNVIYDLELQKDDICYNAQSKTNFEQFGIVTKYATPEELPEFNY